MDTHLPLATVLPFVQVDSYHHYNVGNGMIQVQQLLLEGAWSDRVLALPGCGPALSSSMEVVWVGPRARMGICEAIPNCVVPHTTSGRADYFGPLVNRCSAPLLLAMVVGALEDTRREFC